MGTLASQKRNWKNFGIVYAKSSTVVHLAGKWFAMPSIICSYRLHFNNGNAVLSRIPPENDPYGAYETKVPLRIGYCALTQKSFNSVDIIDEYYVRYCPEMMETYCYGNRARRFIWCRPTIRSPAPWFCNVVVTYRRSNERHIYICFPRRLLCVWKIQS